MPDVREPLMDLCSALGIDLRGLGDDVLETIALRIIADGILPTKPAIEQVIADVRKAETGGSDGRTSTHLSDPPRTGYRFNATEATEAKYRQRLARSHRTEDSRAGLYLVPRRPERMRAGAVHPACKAADAEDADPCARCKPLLHPAICACDVCTDWWAAVDG